ncbi:hypothetical protein VE04_00185 [Pseudogymnoascus sp. 24MN13]|nr:hypothetical protein VE04_00185 [Pseudogymnoascus sp. 24MN13]
MALFLSSSMADRHGSCTCHNGDSYNWRITTLACTKYAEAAYGNGNVAYDTPSGRCTQVTPDDNIMGDQWEEACRAVAQSGFQCADGSDNKCYANTQAVRGSC